MKKTKIICTIGPKSEKKEVLRELINQGLNITRHNFSHGDFAEHLARINTVKELREEMDKPVAILLDTKGPEIRTGKFAEDVVTLIEGEEFILTADDYLGDKNKCQVSYKGLANDVRKGDKILIDDGLIGLEVLSISGSEVKCVILNGGQVKDNKGINVPGVSIKLPAITEKDINDIKFGIENGIDFVAASFIRKAEDVIEIRRVLESNGGHDIQIISKIENQEGVDNLDEIIMVSDGIMVARGDLGVEIPTEQVPLVQKDIIRRCNKAGKPVITATQMLDSMMRNPRPTRAETTDVANAIFDGTDAIMLSGETAAGKYPVESVKMMATIAKASEAALPYESLMNKSLKDSIDDGVTFAVSHATCATAADLKAAAIITATSSGFTAKKISKFRPKAPIIAACTSEKVRRKLAIIWGVESVKVDDSSNTEEIFDKALDESKDAGLIQDGDLVVITAGVPVGVAGATNLMKVHIVGELFLKGTGVGKESTVGKACVARSASELKASFVPGDIIVTNAVDKDIMELVEKASAIVVEEGGYTSPGAIAALSLRIPAVVGVQNATNAIKTGATITVNAAKGICFAGKSRVI